MPEPLIGLHSTKQTNRSSETGCGTRAESRMAKHRETQLEEVHYEITVGMPFSHASTQQLFPYGWPCCFRNSESSRTVIPSTPALPLLALTRANACLQFSRSQTSSINCSPAELAPVKNKKRTEPRSLPLLHLPQKGL